MLINPGDQEFLNEQIPNADKTIKNNLPTNLHLSNLPANLHLSDREMSTLNKVVKFVDDHPIIVTFASLNELKNIKNFLSNRLKDVKFHIKKNTTGFYGVIKRIIAFFSPPISREMDEMKYEHKMLKKIKSCVNNVIKATHINPSLKNKKPSDSNEIETDKLQEKKIDSFKINLIKNDDLSPENDKMNVLINEMKKNLTEEETRQEIHSLEEKNVVSIVSSDFLSIVSSDFLSEKIEVKSDELVPPPPPFLDGPLPPPPPPSGFGPLAPSLPKQTLENEPAEPDFHLLGTEAKLENMSSLQLEVQSKIIEFQIGRMEAALKPVRAAIVLAEELKKSLPEDNKSLTTVKSKITQYENNIKQLEQNEAITFLKLKIKKNETIDIPFFSDEEFKKINSELLDMNEKPIPDKFLKNQEAAILKQELKLLEKEEIILKKTISLKKTNLEEIINSKNNNIKFDQFEKIIESKNKIIQRWTTAKTRRNQQIEKLKKKSQDKKIETGVIDNQNVVQKKSQNPDIEKIKRLKDNRDAFILLFKGNEYHEKLFDEITPVSIEPEKMNLDFSSPPPPPGLETTFHPSPPPPPSSELSFPPPPPSLNGSSLTLPKQMLQNEPHEPEFPLIGVGANLDKMGNLLLQIQNKIIDFQINQMQEALKPLQKAVEEAGYVQKSLPEESKSLISVKSKIAQYEKNIKKLQMDESNTYLKMKVKEDEIFDVPFFSEDGFEKINQELKEIRENSLPFKFLKDQEITSLSKEIKLLKNEEEILMEIIKQDKEKLQKILSSTNNSISFDRFEKIIESKNKIIQKWNTAKARRNQQMEKRIKKAQESDLITKTVQNQNVLVEFKKSHNPLIEQMQSLKKNKDVFILLFKGNDYHEKLSS